MNKHAVPAPAICEMARIAALRGSLSGWTVSAARSENGTVRVRQVAGDAWKVVGFDIVIVLPNLHATSHAATEI